LPTEVKNFVRLLVQEGDFALLPQVSATLVQSASGKSGPLKAEITSAAELSPEEEADIRRMLTEQHGERMVFSFRVDPSLMGGLRVRIGDTLIDTSVASRLARLRESLAAVVR
jgi:F-type H+-transporting ATPase subunit delta